MSRGRSERSLRRAAKGEGTREQLKAHFERLLPSEALRWVEGSASPERVVFRVHHLRGGEEETLEELRALGFNSSRLPLLH